MTGTTIEPGRRFSDIAWIEETGSTNTDLVAFAQRLHSQGQAVPERVLAADHQSQGKGRQGRSFLDAPGRSLLFSVLLRAEMAHATLIPLIKGVAIVRALRVLHGVETGLKWPNDVLAITHGERKMAGILTELAVAAPPVGWIVAGSGINLRAVPEGFEDRAIDLAELLGERRDQIDREALLDEILEQLEVLLALMEREGPEAIRSIYRTECVTIGRSIRLERPNGELEGHAVDIDLDGALIVVDAQGHRHSVTAGDAHHQRHGT